MKTICMLVVAVVALGASCSGDETGDDDKSRIKRAIEAEAQKRAESMILVLGDFPDGWRALPAREDTDADAAFRRCLGLDYTGSTIVGESVSKDFVTGAEDATQASSIATVFGSEAQADRSLDEWARGIGSDKAEGCMSRFVENDSDAEVHDLEIRELNFTAPATVDETNAWRAVIPFTFKSGPAEGRSATSYLDLVEMRDGDEIATLNTHEVATPFDRDLLASLLQALAARMSNAQELRRSRSATGYQRGQVESPGRRSGPAT